MKKNCKGALTVEAVLFLIPFMCAFLVVINAARVIQTQILVQHAITQSCKQISTYSYLMTKSEIVSRIQKTNEKGDAFKKDVDTTYKSITDFTSGALQIGSSSNIGDEISNVLESGEVAVENVENLLGDPDNLAQGMMACFKSGVRGAAMSKIAGALTKASIVKTLGNITDDPNEYMINLGIEDGLNGLDFSNTKWLSNSGGKGNIEIIVTYKVKGKMFEYFELGEYNFQQCASTLIW